MFTSSFPNTVYCQHQQEWSSGTSVLRQPCLDELAKQVRLQTLKWPTLNNRGITVYLRRDDELSHYYSGNKYYKLYYNLRNALQQGADALVSYGGVYSNHLYALASAGQELGIPTVGIIRGYENVALTPTLKDAASRGMKLFFLGKKDYRNKNISSILPILNKCFQNYYLIPEGGENIAGSRGCMAIGKAVSAQLNHLDRYTLCCAVGTGSTLAGLVASSPRANCLGFSVLKGEDKLTAKIHHWLSLLGSDNTQWDLVEGYHHGGYGKVSPELLAFMSEFEERNQLSIEPVYTAKMLWGIEQLAKQQYWPEESVIVAVHTGGLQGRRGFDLSPI